MNEFDLICTSITAGLFGAAVVVVPVLVYRWIFGIPLIPDHKPIDAGSRRDRNRLMLNVVGSFGFSPLFFAGNCPVCGCALLLLGVFSIAMFEHYDRNYKSAQEQRSTA